MYVHMKWSVNILLLALLGALVFAPAVGASNDGTMKQVLLLFSHKRGVPGHEILEKTITSVLEAGTSDQLEFYIEYMDSSRFNDEEYAWRFYELFHQKYSALAMDLLIPLQVPALDFLLQHGEDIFPGAPIAFTAIPEKSLDNLILTPNVTGVTQGLDILGTVEIALKLHPDTRHIATITGAAPTDRQFEKIARTLFQRYEKQVKVHYLGGLPMDELLAWVENPPEQTLLFYFAIHEDGTGKFFLPLDAMKAICQVSEAPVYSFLDLGFGHGIVGGHLSSVEAIGTRTAEIGLRILQGEQVADIPILHKASNAYMFDWRQLKRWGIHEKSLPPESIVRYKESSLWDRYKWYILGTITLILLETLLLAVMFTLQIRLRRTQGALRTSEERYELAVTGSDAGIWDWDIPSGAIYYSRRFKELLGYRPDEFSETVDAFFDRLHPEDAEAVRGAFDRHLQDHVPYDIEYRLRTRSETYRWFHARGQAIWDESEQAVRMSGAIHDVTRRKQSEKHLRTAYTEIEKLKQQLQEENVYLQEEIKQIHNVENIVGQNSGIKHVLYKVKEIAPTDIAVLILGETGTGKELFARAIHHLSLRKAHPLVKVNCATLSATLIESELFGHEKGAFTGSDRQRKGRFELADGATLFLDEIGELPLELQAKLLQVLQNGEFERLGGNKTLTVDVRIIAATNRNLTTEVQQGRFRKDLYYRLNKYSITIPPLRERPDDIPLLMKNHLKHAERKLGKEVRTVPASVMQTLQTYSWPGNVRELENVVERAVLATQGDTLYLPESFQEPELTSETSSPSESEGKSATKKFDAIARRGTLEELEREYIQQILEECYWRIGGPKGAAVILGLHPNTLRARMRKLGLQRPSD